MIGWLISKMPRKSGCPIAGSTASLRHIIIVAWKDLPHPLANVADNAGSFPLGDYDHVLAIGKDFYGAFSANNYPDTKNFYPGVKYQRFVDWGAHQLYADAGHTISVSPSVDPFFFKVTPDPCQSLSDSVDALEQEVQDLIDALAAGEIPAPPRTPEKIAKVEAFIHKLEANLRRLRAQLKHCRMENPSRALRPPARCFAIITCLNQLTSDEGLHHSDVGRAFFSVRIRLPPDTKRALAKRPSG